MVDNALARAVSILEALVDAGEPIGPRALARLSGVDRSAVGRILQQLETLDVLVKDDGKYEPGPRLFGISRTLNALDTLPTAAVSALGSLVAEFDETSYVCVRHGSSLVFLYETQSSKPLRYIVDLGRPVPLHAGAAGRAILVGVSEDEAREMVSAAPLENLTCNTVTSIEALLELRAADVEKQYSISVEERVEGGAAVAAPFYDHTGVCQGSVVLTAPVTRFAKMDSEKVGAAVARTAEVLSARLGAPHG